LQVYIKYTYKVLDLAGIKRLPNYGKPFLITEFIPYGKRGHPT
jgi:hypothetical protein